MEIKRRIVERTTASFVFKTIDRSGRSEQAIEWKRALKKLFVYFAHPCLDPLQMRLFKPG